jgi:ABC-type branched-subunit amino acid transport system substrate-binding protein
MIFNQEEVQMKKFLVLLSIFVFCGVFNSGNNMAADPDKIKVGILLPLTGTFAMVAETQRDGALLAVDGVNKKGGLNMPWGKVKVEGVVADDEAKQDVGVRRYRYMVSEGVKGPGRRSPTPSMPWFSKSPCPISPFASWPKRLS